MTGAAVARSIVDAVRDDATATLIASTAYQTAGNALAGKTDVIDAMNAAVGLIVAAETLRDAAGALAAGARSALAGAMMDNGATGIQTAHHAATAVSARRSVMLTGDVPAEYMTVSKPIIDMDAIRRDLTAGRRLDFATFSNGGAPYLRITARK